MNEERLPPQNREAEQGVLGAMLRDNRVIDDVLQIIDSEERFYQDRHQKIFKAIVDLFDAGKRIDLVTLAEELRRRNELEDVGRAEYIAELWDAAPTTGMVGRHAEIVRDKALARGVIHAATEILRDAYDGGQPADELLEEAERKILAVGEARTMRTAAPLKTAIRESLDWIENRISAPTKNGVPSGFPVLDQLTGGFHDSELTILAARPSVGKTALAVAFTRNIARAGFPVLLVSLEQSRRELGVRLLCMESGVDGGHVRRGMITGSEVNAIQAAADRLEELPILIDDLPGQKIQRIAAVVRAMRRRRGIRLVAVDYLQLVASESNRENRQEQVSNISRRLKLLARESECPVVALAQLNRGVEDRAEQKPRLSDLRDSGALEQDADTVMLLWRKPDDAIELIVAKQRNGPLGDVPLTFNKATTKFESQTEQIPWVAGR